MTTRRRSASGKPERHVWVFSEPNPDVSPMDVARLLANYALRSAATRPVTEPEDD